MRVMHAGTTQCTSMAPCNITVLSSSCRGISTPFYGYVFCALDKHLVTYLNVSTVNICFYIYIYILEIVLAKAGPVFYIMKCRISPKVKLCTWNDCLFLQPFSVI